MTMTAGETSLLRQNLDSATNYLEFGAGESTIFACASRSIQKIYSVESSRRFIEENLLTRSEIAKEINSGRLTLHIVDIGSTGDWGHPTERQHDYLWPNYPLSIFSRRRDFDLVLIDGRFRVACTLSAILSCPVNCRIIFHDFAHRREYRPILDFLEIEESQDSLVLLKVSARLQREKARKILRKYLYLPDDKTIPVRLRRRIGFQ